RNLLPCHGLRPRTRWFGQIRTNCGGGLAHPYRMKIPSLPGFDPEAFNKYFTNTGWLIMARAGSLFIKMIITAIAIPNYLGNSLNGVLNYPLVLVTFFMAACTLGMDSFVTRQLLRHPKDQYTILGT